MAEIQKAAIEAVTSAELVDYKEVFEVVDSYIKKQRHWAYNRRCKYVGIYIDMRDGLCSIKDRRGKYITLEELKKQVGV